MKGAFAAEVEEAAVTVEEAEASEAGEGALTTIEEGSEEVDEEVAVFEAVSAVGLLVGEVQAAVSLPAMVVTGNGTVGIVNETAVMDLEVGEVEATVGLEAGVAVEASGMSHLPFFFLIPLHPRAT